jgi:hypothetical protein
VSPCSIANTATAARVETPIFRYEFLDVAVGGLDRDAERMRHLLGLQTARQQGHDPDLALGQTRWMLDRRRLLPRRFQHGAHRLAIEPPGPALLPDHVRGVLGWDRLAVRPWLGHRLVGIGGREQPRSGSERAASNTAVVARAVEPRSPPGRARRGTASDSGRAR